MDAGLSIFLYYTSAWFTGDFSMRLPASVVEHVAVSTLRSGDVLLTPSGLIWVRVMTDGAIGGINLSSTPPRFEASRLMLALDNMVLCVKAEKLDVGCEILSLPADAESFRFGDANTPAHLGISPKGWFVILHYDALQGAFTGPLIESLEYGVMQRWGGEVVPGWRIELRLKGSREWFARWNPAIGIEFPV